MCYFRHYVLIGAGLGVIEIVDIKLEPRKFFRCLLSVFSKPPPPASSGTPTVKKYHAIE